MTTLEDLERAYESKWSFDEELKFKIAARTTRLFGQWAATELGLERDVACAYARALVLAEVDPQTRIDAQEKVATDLQAAGRGHDRRRIARQWDSCLNEARRQIGAG
jgi:hypothetical protein